MHHCILLQCMNHSKEKNIKEHFSPPSSYFHGITSENMVLLCSSAPV